MIYYETGGSDHESLKYPCVWSCYGQGVGKREVSVVSCGDDGGPYHCGVDGWL